MTLASQRSVMVSSGLNQMLTQTSTHRKLISPTPFRVRTLESLRSSRHGLTDSALNVSFDASGGVRAPAVAAFAVRLEQGITGCVGDIDGAAFP